MNTSGIKPFSPGQDVRSMTRRLEELRSRISQISQIDGGGVGVSQLEGGTSVFLPPQLTPGGMRDVIDTFSAIITGSTLFSGGGATRFKYAWSESEFISDSVNALSSPTYRTGTTSLDYALNLQETFNSSQYQAGVDTQGADYPDGFELRPVGGAGTDNSHKYNVPVIMYEVINSVGVIQYWFSAPNSHDGTCDAP